MSQFAHERPEEWLAIASLPPSEQNGALRAAMSAYAYDPDRVLGRLEELELENASAREEQSQSSSLVVGQTSRAVDHIYSRRRTGVDCDSCGAPEDAECQPWCLGERYS